MYAMPQNRYARKGHHNHLECVLSMRMKLFAFFNKFERRVGCCKCASIAGTPTSVPSSTLFKTMTIIVTDAKNNAIMRHHVAVIAIDAT
jgi:hypothetical protein